MLRRTGADAATADGNAAGEDARGFPDSREAEREK